MQIWERCEIIIHLFKSYKDNKRHANDRQLIKNSGLICLLAHYSFFIIHYCELFYNQKDTTSSPYITGKRINIYLHCRSAH